MKDFDRVVCVWDPERGLASSRNLSVPLTTAAAPQKASRSHSQGEEGPGPVLAVRRREIGQGLQQAVNEIAALKAVLLCAASPFERGEETRRGVGAEQRP